MANWDNADGFFTLEGRKEVRIVSLDIAVDDELVPAAISPDKIKEILYVKNVWKRCS